ncbi:S41 family peptidase [Brevundimonas sp. TWP1-2-1b1]|uniref:S41 family peptidase n=1 Tax=unclassified Brevundimonas TaxID=2622653 RepID=UPI003CE843B7
MPSLNRRRLLQMSAGLSLASACPAWAQSRSDDWSGDVAILRAVWETMHPGLYRYSTPAEITTRLDALGETWRAPGSFRERFLALTRVTASIRCGHTYPSPYNGDDAMVAAMYPDRSLVPFRFRWIDDRIVITEDHTTSSALPRGTVVSAIDGVATETLLARLVPLARADGGNDAKRINLMEVRGEDRFETFDIHLPLILPLKDEAAFTLADGRIVRAPLLTLAERQSRLAPSASPTGDANPWTLESLPDGFRRLTMPSWALFNSTFAWEAWLGETVDALSSERARGLIIDLRGNEGGLDCGALILSRLIDRDLPVSRNQRWTRYRSAPASVRPYLHTWDRSFLDWGDQAQPSTERPGFYRLTRYDDDAEGTVIRPAGTRFTGPVAVLCDASNSSATFAFAQAVQQSGAATLIGQPTGGNRRGINGGAFFFLKLPASGIEIDLPLIASFPDTPQPDAAIQPDVLVQTTAEDIASGRDPQMGAAMAFITSE